MVKISEKLAGGLSQLKNVVAAAAIRSPSPPKPMPSAISRLAATNGNDGRALVVPERRELVRQRTEPVVGDHAAHSQFGPRRGLEISVCHIGGHVVALPILGHQSAQPPQHLPPPRAGCNLPRSGSSTNTRASPSGASCPRQSRPCPGTDSPACRCARSATGARPRRPRRKSPSSARPCGSLTGLVTYWNRMPLRVSTLAKSCVPCTPWLSIMCAMRERLVHRQQFLRVPDHQRAVACAAARAASAGWGNT